MMKMDDFYTSNAKITINQESSPFVRVYSGVEGIKEVYRDTLTTPPDESIYALLNPKSVHPEIFSWLNDTYTKQRVKQGIFANVFITKGQGEEVSDYANEDEKALRKTFLVERYDFDFECEVNIYADKVALIDYTPNMLRALIIQDKIITKTMKSFYLHYLWKQ